MSFFKRTSYNPDTHVSESRSDEDYICTNTTTTDIYEMNTSVYTCPHCVGLFKVGSLGTYPVTPDPEPPTPYIEYEEKQTDMLELPVYYHIAHCIPCDMTFWGETANRINQLYGTKNILEEYFYGQVEVGDVVLDKNVFTMFSTEQKYHKTTLEALKKCARKLAEYCKNEKIKYLAMPHVGCGHGGLNWLDVRGEFLDSMMEVFTVDDDGYRPFITFCYQ